MVIQSEKKDYFSSEDIQVFRAITTQLAATIETARLLITLNDKKEKIRAPVPEDLKFIQGRCGSEGVAFATTMIVNESLTDMQQYDDCRREAIQLKLTFIGPWKKPSVSWKICKSSWKQHCLI